MFAVMDDNVRLVGLQATKNIEETSVTELTLDELQTVAGGKSFFKDPWTYIGLTGAGAFAKLAHQVLIPGALAGNENANVPGNAAGDAALDAVADGEGVGGALIELGELAGEVALA
ncbi:hypothetical protein [Martelella limonii]|uniref:hypothetical protein n=1 Tax=Martelella limonii TaxID=1647649 RepID=UPI00157FD181|nr:hypothetical protein [Martelella limonii]